MNYERIIPCYILYNYIEMHNYFLYKGNVLCKNMLYFLLIRVSSLHYSMLSFLVISWEWHVLHLKKTFENKLYIVFWRISHFTDIFTDILPDIYRTSHFTGYRFDRISRFTWYRVLSEIPIYRISHCYGYRVLSELVFYWISCFTGYRVLLVIALTGYCILLDIVFNLISCFIGYRDNPILSFSRIHVVREIGFHHF